MTNPNFSFLPDSGAPLAIGPSGWHYPHWDGIVYPKRRPRGFHPLDVLSEQFDAVEIAASFEADIRPELARLWAARVDANPRFRFAARMHRRFTLDRDLSPESVESFAAGLRELRKARRLGAVLMQFPWTYRFTRENREHLLALRQAFRDFPLVAEMRHESWMSPDAVGTMIDYRIGFCNLDQPEQVRAMPPTAFLTSPIAYFRLHGRGRTPLWEAKAAPARMPAAGPRGYSYSPAELAAWRERIEQVRGIAERSFCFFTNDGGGQAVINALQLSRMMERPTVLRKPAAAEADRNLRLAVA